MKPRHARQRVESADQDQPTGAVLGGQVDLHAPAQRFAAQDNFVFGETRSLGQPAACAAGIGQNSRLAGRTLAPAVTAIVEHQHAGAERLEIVQQVVPMGDIAGITVRNQHHGPRFRHVDIPTVQV